MSRRPIFALGALLGAALLNGCNPRDAQNLSQDTRQLAQHAGESVGNAALDGKVKMVLSLRKGVDMTHLVVAAQDGVVTLSGHVRDKAERRRILNTVNGIRGVDKVVADDLRIGP